MEQEVEKTVDILKSSQDVSSANDGFSFMLIG